MTTAKSNKKQSGTAGVQARGAAVAAKNIAESAEALPFIDVLIVGGGFSGLLAAAQLSHKDQQGCDGAAQQHIVVMESKDSLGGRLVLGNLVKNLLEPVASEGGAVDARGIGSFPLSLFGDSLKPLLDAFHECFTPDEQAAMVSMLTLDAQAASRPASLAQTSKSDAKSAFAKEARGTFVVRKEFTPGPLMCVGPSECLTRTAAQSLGSFLNGAENARLRDTVFWKELRKPAREELRPFFETLAGDEFEKADAQFLVRGLRLALGSDQSPVSGWNELLRASVADFCRAVGEILVRRGVTIRLQTRVERLEKLVDKQAGRVIYTAKAVMPGAAPVSLKAATVILTVPLSQSLVVMSRDLLTPAESKFVTRIRPRSAVVLELADPFAAPEYAALGLAKPGETSRFLFPIERVQALQTPEGRLIFYAWLDYEVSLQAPGVREVLGRLKRAFRRIFNETELETFARLAGSAALTAAAPARPGVSGQESGEKAAAVRRDLGERLVLIPVAQSVPPEPYDLPEIPAAAAEKVEKSTSLVFVGEHFAPAQDALQSILLSVPHGVQCVRRALEFHMMSAKNTAIPAIARAGATSAPNVEEGAGLAVLEKS